MNTSASSFADRAQKPKRTLLNDKVIGSDAGLMKRPNERWMEGKKFYSRVIDKLGLIYRSLLFLVILVVISLIMPIWVINYLLDTHLHTFVMD